MVFAVGIFAWSIYQEVKPKTEVGVMEYRMISGVQDDIFKVILLETDDKFNVHDTEFLDVIQDNDAEVISRPEQLRMMQKYDNLQYRVNFFQYPKEEQHQYRTSRDVFNQMKFNNIIKFEIDRKVRDSIVAIIEM